MSRKHTSRPVTVSLKKPRKGATAKAVTVSSKKPKKGGAAAPRSATPLEPPRDDLSSLGSPVNLASRLERGTTTSARRLRKSHAFVPPGPELSDDAIQDDDDDVDDIQDVYAVMAASDEEPDVHGLGGEVYDNFESVFHAASANGENEADSAAMARAVVAGLEDEPQPEDDDADQRPNIHQSTVGEVKRTPRRSPRFHQDMRKSEEEGIKKTPRRSPRLNSEPTTPPSNDSAPYQRSIRTPNGRHFDRDAMESWSDWANNGRYCNGLPPYDQL